MSIRPFILALVLALSGCATTFETDRDRVLILGFGFTAAFVSNKTTKGKGETKEPEKSEDSEEGEK